MTSAIDIRPVATRTAQNVAPTLTMRQLAERIELAEAIMVDHTDATESPTYLGAEAALKVYRAEWRERYA